MPAPPRSPQNFRDILDLVWWRLDVALDLDTIYWSAKLGALEALEAGTTAIIDHHESPNAIEGSLDVIAQACREVGVRVDCAYGVTDRHGHEAALRGLAENERFIRSGGRGRVGVHAAFTCTDETLEAAAGLAADLGSGVHIHVAEGVDDVAAGQRLESLATDDWLIVHAVHLDRDLPGTIAHNPRSNMNNGVGYANPTARQNRTVLGSDGIGANMLAEFQFAYFRHREADVEATPDSAWGWLEAGRGLFPEATSDTIEWSYDTMEPWHLAFSTGVRPLNITVDGEQVLSDGVATKVDADEVRAKAAEAATRLHRSIEELGS